MSPPLRGEQPRQLCGRESFPRYCNLGSQFNASYSLKALRWGTYSMILLFFVLSQTRPNESKPPDSSIATCCNGHALGVFYSPVGVCRTTKLLWLRSSQGYSGVMVLQGLQGDLIVAS